MNRKIGAVLGSAAVLLALLLTWVLGKSGGVLAVAMILVLFLVWATPRHIWVRVAEMETAVTFNRESKAFMRFLPPGRHLLAFPIEQVKATFSTAATNVRGRCSGAQTREGVVVAVDWSLTYLVKPDQIAPEMRMGMARGLPAGIGGLLREQANNCIALLTNEKRVEGLCQNGRRAQFQEELTRQLQRRLDPFGLTIIRFIVTEVDLPPQVRASLEEAIEREVEAISEANALNVLHEAISQFSEADMEMLLRLRQIREMGQNGVTLHAPLGWTMAEAPRPKRTTPVSSNGRRPTVVSVVE
jgi:regulator of protease activity HflC (stomatin/prohibitin superfamily)